MLVDRCDICSDGLSFFRSDRGSMAHISLMRALPTKSTRNGCTTVGRRPLSESEAILIAVIGTPFTYHCVPTLCYSHPTRPVCASKLYKRKRVFVFFFAHNRRGNGSTRRETHRVMLNTSSSVQTCKPDHRPRPCLHNNKKVIHSNSRDSPRNIIQIRLHLLCKPCGAHVIRDTARVFISA